MAPFCCGAALFCAGGGGWSLSRKTGGARQDEERDERHPDGSGGVHQPRVVADDDGGERQEIDGRAEIGVPREVDDRGRCRAGARDDRRRVPAILRRTDQPHAHAVGDIEKRRGKLCAGILDRHAALAESGQRGDTPRVFDDDAVRTDRAAGDAAGEEVAQLTVANRLAPIDAQRERRTARPSSQVTKAIAFSV